MSANVLVVDDDPSVCAALAATLGRVGYSVECVASSAAALDMLATAPFDVALFDLNLPDGDGISLLERAQQGGFDGAALMMSGQGSIAKAVEALNRGASDFIEKPFQPERVRQAVANALRLAALATDNARLRQDAHAGDVLLGVSVAMTDVRTLIARAAPTDARVLITGENGTGKELVARSVHAGSTRAQGPFVKINCAAIPGELIESELFGHERGAFTGASRAKKGRFELANGGTLFLDEIGDTSPSMQAKLLRVLQEGEFERVGGETTLKVDVRLIAATNRDLEAMCRKRQFREDLFYRINVLRIAVPPLRERPEDVAMLAQEFLSVLSGRHQVTQPKLTDDALRLLTEYRFPGNVRELQNLVERFVILSDGVAVTAQQVRAALPIELAKKSKPKLYEAGVSWADLMTRAQRAILRQALAANDQNMSVTARELGLARSLLYKKCQAVGIKAARNADGDSSEDE